MEPDIDLLSSLQCYHFPVNESACGRDLLSHYYKSFHLWYATVQDGLRSLQLDQRAQDLTSDEFVSCDEFVALFHDDMPVGLFMFNWMNLDSPVDLMRSYFHNYPEGFVSENLSKKHKTIMTMRHLMVSRDWRKSKIGPGVADILVSFAVRRFLETSASVLITFTRNDRKTHELGHRHGGESLCRDMSAYNSTSDALVFYRDKVHDTIIQGLSSVVNTLWSNKINGFKVHVPVGESV